MAKKTATAVESPDEKAPASAEAIPRVAEPEAHLSSARAENTQPGEADVPASRISSEESLQVLWKETYAVYYDSHYQEVEAELVVNAWQRFDDAVKVLVAVTASSSAVAGWSMWNTPGFRNIWAIIAGTGALAAIVHASLGVPNRLKEWGETHRFFLILRNDVQTLRQQMRINSYLPLSAFLADFETARRRFAEGQGKVRVDFLRTNRLRSKAQQFLNQRIEQTLANRRSESNEL